MKGTVVAAGADVGTRLDSGAILGTIRSQHDSYDVTATHGGAVLEWLVEGGNPVAPGQPLVRVHPEAEAT